MLTEQQLAKLEQTFTALPSCTSVQLRANRTGMILDADFKNQANFFEEVKACAEKHYEVMRVTYDNK